MLCHRLPPPGTTPSSRQFIPPAAPRDYRGDPGILHYYPGRRTPTQYDAWDERGHCSQTLTPWDEGCEGSDSYGDWKAQNRGPSHRAMPFLPHSTPAHRPSLTHSTPPATSRNPPPLLPISQSPSPVHRPPLIQSTPPMPLHRPPVIQSTPVLTANHPPPPSTPAHRPPLIQPTPPVPPNHPLSTSAHHRPPVAHHRPPLTQSMPPTPAHRPASTPAHCPSPTPAHCPPPTPAHRPPLMQSTPKLAHRPPPSPAHQQPSTLPPRFPPTPSNHHQPMSAPRPPTPEHRSPLPVEFRNHRPPLSYGTKPHHLHVQQSHTQSKESRISPPQYRATHLPHHSHIPPSQYNAAPLPQQKHSYSKHSKSSSHTQHKSTVLRSQWRDAPALQDTLVKSSVGSTRQNQDWNAHSVNRGIKSRRGSCDRRVHSADPHQPGMDRSVVLLDAPPPPPPPPAPQTNARVTHTQERNPSPINLSKKAPRQDPTTSHHPSSVIHAGSPLTPPPTPPIVLPIHSPSLRAAGDGLPRRLEGLARTLQDPTVVKTKQKVSVLGGQTDPPKPHVKTQDSDDLLVVASFVNKVPHKKRKLHGEVLQCSPKTAPLKQDKDRKQKSAVTSVEEHRSPKKQVVNQETVRKHTGTVSSFTSESLHKKRLGNADQLSLRRKRKALKRQIAKKKLQLSLVYDELLNRKLPSMIRRQFLEEVSKDRDTKQDKENKDKKRKAENIQKDQEKKNEKAKEKADEISVVASVKFQPQNRNLCPQESVFGRKRKTAKEVKDKKEEKKKDLKKIKELKNKERKAKKKERIRLKGKLILHKKKMKKEKMWQKKKKKAEEKQRKEEELKKKNRMKSEEEKGKERDKRSEEEMEVEKRREEEAKKIDREKSENEKEKERHSRREEEDKEEKNKEEEALKIDGRRSETNKNKVEEIKKNEKTKSSSKEENEKENHNRTEEEKKAEEIVNMKTLKAEAMKKTEKRLRGIPDDLPDDEMEVYVDKLIAELGLKLPKTRDRDHDTREEEEKCTGAEECECSECVPPLKISECFTVTQDTFMSLTCEEECEGMNDTCGNDATTSPSKDNQVSPTAAEGGGGGCTSVAEIEGSITTTLTTSTASPPFCYTCKQVNGSVNNGHPEEDIRGHLYFGTVSCSFCDLDVYICHYFRAIRNPDSALRTCSESPTRRHDFSRWKGDPYSYLISNVSVDLLACQDSDSDPKQISVHDICLAVARYVKSLDVLGDEYPWRSAIEMCWNGIRKAGVLVENGDCGNVLLEDIEMVNERNKTEEGERYPPGAVLIGSAEEEVNRRMRREMEKDDSYPSCAVFVGDAGKMDRRRMRNDVEKDSPVLIGFPDEDVNRGLRKDIKQEVDNFNTSLMEMEQGTEDEEEMDIANHSITEEIREQSLRAINKGIFTLLQGYCPPKEPSVINTPADRRFLVVRYPSQECPEECPDCYVPTSPMHCTYTISTGLITFVCPACHLTIYILADQNEDVVFQGHIGVARRKPCPKSKYCTPKLGHV